MIYGYCRISTKKQSIERQIRNIKAAYPKAVVIEEIYSGRRMERKEFAKLLSKLQKGDVVIFDSVSRMSRDAEDGFKLYKELFDKGVELVFLKESYINTATYRKALTNNIQMTNTTVDSILKGINEYLLALAEEQIKIAFEQAEKEVKDLSQRTKEGLVTAKLNGKQIGGVKHMYAYWLGVTHRNEEELAELVNELNNKFTRPLRQSEVKAILRCVPKAIDKFIDYEQGLRAGKVKRVSKGMRDKGGYWYKNETIIELLDITIEEQRQLKTIIGTQVKYERNNVKRTPKNEAGLTAKQQELADLRIKVLELRAQGLSLRAVAKELNISLRDFPSSIDEIEKYKRSNSGCLLKWTNSSLI